MADNRSRLEKLVGMLGSDYDGERANAAALIAKIAKEEKKSMVELLLHPQVIYRDREKIVYRDRPQPQQQKPNRDREKPRWSDDDAWNTFFRDAGQSAGYGRGRKQDKLSVLRTLSNSEHLSPWERSFARDVGYRYDFDDELSEAQLDVIEKILKKVKLREERAANPDPNI